MKCIFGFENCKTLSHQIEINPYQFFIGYQIKSNYYNQSKILAMGNRICEILNSDLQKYNLSIINSQFGFEEGIHIFCEPCKLIQKSILCIFEISDLNPNVMLEIGKSLYKNIILLRRKDAAQPPSDMGGIIYDEYSIDNELLTAKSAKFANIISEKVLEHNKMFSCSIKQEFFLKDEINRIIKADTFHENINWSDLLEIYDEDKLNTPHDFTLIGIAKYKRIKDSFLKEKINEGDIENVEKYFLKSKVLNKKIIENYYYLYLLELLKTTIKILEDEKKSVSNIIKKQDELDITLMDYKDIWNLINFLFNKNLKEFMFIDSPILIEKLTSFDDVTNPYNVLRFLQKNNILKDFNKKILNLIINSQPNRRYAIVGEISRELTFNDIGEDIIELLKKSIEIENKNYYDIETGYYVFNLDQDLKEKLSYLLGIFGDIRAENILISLIDNNKGYVIGPAIDALGRVNSIKSIPFLINLYKNTYIDYPLRLRIENTINILCEKNNFISLKNIFGDNKEYFYKH